MQSIRGMRALCAMVVLLCLPVARAADGGAQVKIESPKKDAVINGNSIPVSGTLVARTRNVAVTVNDVVALVDVDHAGTKGDPFRWFAAVQPAAGRVKLKARVHLTGAGVDDGEDTGTGASTLHVHFVPAPAALSLRATPASGITPLDVTFSIRMNSPGEVALLELDTDGNGTWDRTATSVSDDFAVRYSTPGIRLVTARVTMKDGSRSSAITAINAQSFQTMNALLKEVWSGFRQSLAARDVDAALGWFTSENVREKYRRPLTQILSSLPGFADGIKTLDAVWIREDVARYLATRVENGRPTGYHVYFGRNANGLWKIVQF